MANSDQNRTADYFKAKGVFNDHPKPFTKATFTLC